jgi:hypothetical protein
MGLQAQQVKNGWTELRMAFLHKGKNPPDLQGGFFARIIRIILGGEPILGKNFC